MHDRLAEAVGEQRTIRQAGERVELSKEREAALAFDALQPCRKQARRSGEKPGFFHAENACPVDHGAQRPARALLAIDRREGRLATGRPGKRQLAAARLAVLEHSPEDIAWPVIRTGRAWFVIRQSLHAAQQHLALRSA